MHFAIVRKVLCVREQLCCRQTGPRSVGVTIVILTQREARVYRHLSRPDGLRRLPAAERANEVGTMLSSTEESVTSALKRARAKLEQGLIPIMYIIQQVTHAAQVQLGVKPRKQPCWTDFAISYF